MLRRIRLGNDRPGFPQPKAQGAEEPLALAHAERDVEVVVQIGRDGLAVPDGAREPDGRRFLAQHPRDLRPLARGEARRASGPIVIAQSLQAIGLEPMDPILDRPQRVAEQRGDVGARHPLRDQQHPMQAVIVPRIRGTTNLVLQTEYNGRVRHEERAHEPQHYGAFRTCAITYVVVYNNLGNVATDTSAGWRTTKDKRYHDVQCESCHGAGLQHVQTPARGQMLPSIKADTGKAITNGCSECHSGTHQPFVEQWRTSRHATSYTRAYNGTTATAPEVPGGPRAACQGCHIGQKVLEAWGVNTNFTEKSQGQTAASAVGVACAVCHDPHGSTNSKQLRFAVDSRDPDNNLCMKCHLRRAVPDFSSSYGTRPHSPQGPMLLGTAGWWPPGIEVDGDLVASHGTERNPKLCASCHVNRYQVTDKATGKFVQRVTGHRFDAIPCVDANGLPTPSQTCTITQRSFKSCAASGCHTESSARTIMVTAEADIKFLARTAQPRVPQRAATVAPAARARRPTGAGELCDVSQAARLHAVPFHDGVGDQPPWPGLRYPGG